MESIGRLAGGVAHDFNNLLTAILGFSEILIDESGPAEPDAREDLQAIHKAAEHGASLTRQLLAFSRRQILEPTILDPRRPRERPREHSPAAARRGCGYAVDRRPELRSGSRPTRASSNKC